MHTGMTIAEYYGILAGIGYYERIVGPVCQIAGV
jgi:hypothetical protein